MKATPRGFRLIQIVSALLGMLVGVNAMAGDADKSAGICAAYLVFTKNPAAQMALNSADNQTRASNFGLTWMREIKRNGNSQVAAYEGDSACRKIGIRPGDYR